MKKYIAFILALCLSFSLLASCGDSSSQDPDAPAESKPSVIIPEKNETPAEPLKDSGELGDFEVRIHDYEIVSDYEGSPAILIAYTFVNHSEENANALVSLVCTAYQNGVELDSAYITDHEGYDAADEMRDIKPEASIELLAAYSLVSETEPVEFEVEEAFSFSDDMLGKTFYLSDKTTIDLGVAPAGSYTAEIGDYTVSIVSYKLTEDYDGAPAILIELGFTNNGDAPDNFASAISFDAFQDGIELETAILMDDNAGSGTSQMRNIKPGAGATVTAAFVLTSDTAVVEIEMAEFFSFSDEKATVTIDIAG